MIVTHTDHDFVDVTVKGAAEGTAGKTAAKAGEKGAVKALARRRLTRPRSAWRRRRRCWARCGWPRQPLGHSAGGSGQHRHPRRQPQDAHLQTTFHHPFYDETRSAFVEAKDLQSGDVLSTRTGTAEVMAVRLYHAHTTTYDLTVGALHTYYVLAGDIPVLVHNATKCGRAPAGHAYRGGQYKDLKGPNGLNIPGTEINHMPSSQANSAVFGIPEGQGLAIQMDEADHVLTRKLGIESRRNAAPGTPVVSVAAGPSHRSPPDGRRQRAPAIRIEIRQRDGRDGGEAARLH